jgi:hypothetical protein
MQAVIRWFLDTRANDLGKIGTGLEFDQMDCNLGIAFYIFIYRLRANIFP